ncbi:MAG: PPC domain-containing protein [Planctomycetaceae bacterium]
MRCARLIAVALACSAAPATGGPTIGRIEPAGAPAGAEVEIRLVGGDLGDPQELFFEEGRIAVAALAGVDDKTVKATLRVPADCPPGPHRLRVRTRHGLSELRTFRVGGFAQVAEIEPNDAAAAAQPLEPGRTVAGVVKGEDVDCFRVHLAAGQRIAAAVDAMRLDQEMFDPHLELVDSRGFVVAACDDHPLLGSDAMLAATAPEAGDYVIRLRESAYGGGDGCVYLLHVGDFPIASLAWPPVGAPGATLDVEWLGDPAGPFRQQVRLPDTVPVGGVAEVLPCRDGRTAPGAVPVRVSALAAATESEPNDEPAKATPATAPTGCLGRLEKPEDVDWFRIAAPRGTNWHVRGWGRRVGAPIDLVINVHRDDEKRERITGNDDAEGPDAVARVTVPDQGSFLVRVTDHLRRGGPDFVYWVELVPAEPAVTVSVPPGRSNSQERLVAVVPRGNRTALLLNAARSDCDRPATLACAGLPAGVTAAAAPLPPNAPAAPMVFEAAADAPPTTALTAVDVRTADDGHTLGGLRQTTELVVGQPNNATYRTSVSDRLPVAVVEPASIRITVDPPAVPLVRRGSLELRVRVERLDGFEGRVRLWFPFKPPGISTPSSVDIPEDKSEAAYLLNANADAALGTWPVVVTAMAKPKGAKDRDDVAPLVSSALVPLEVAEPLVQLAADKVAVEQGHEVAMVWKVTKPGEFVGAAKARLLGLPAKTEAPELDLEPGATEVSFPLQVGSDAPPGQHPNVFCELRVPRGDAWIVHQMPPTQLRIDIPLPAEQPAPETKPDAP